MSAELKAHRLEKLIKAEVHTALENLPHASTGEMQITSIVIRIAGLPDVTIEPTPDRQ